ncbi:unnamed protein product [Caenorhabditis angaria]|uniref:RNA-binding protein NOB1 n=1 Tax=Caenorhabditis angaria TaxID=860376 RepID=A0A9P1IAJ0_9PELO|nr:unnamed protein product [Caenorhabditis angaria]
MASTKSKPVKHLVLDTCAIIANPDLHQLAELYYAPHEIISELQSQKARKIWDTLPFEVVLREPTPQALREVIEAAKKTGDFQSLSMVDMKVIALTYDLNQQFVVKKSEVAEKSSEEEIAEISKKNMEELNEKLGEVRVTSEGEASDAESAAEDSESELEDSEDEGWITAENIDETLKKLGGFEVEEGMLVGCITTDFALQNVLLFMNLSLVSLNGYRIRKLKSFVLRCRTCFTTTSIMTKEFCPACGHKTLHKCAVSVDENGEQQLHINWNRLANLRGLRYTLAEPKGGKHSVNEKLFEDQPMPHMRMAKIHMDPLADGPFTLHDVVSRSAMLGVRTMNNRSKQNRNRNEAKRGGRRK